MAILYHPPPVRAPSIIYTGGELEIIAGYLRGRAGE
jgi:hypothetical protein